MGKCCAVEDKISVDGAVGVAMLTREGKQV